MLQAGEADGNVARSILGPAFTPAFSNNVIKLTLQFNMVRKVCIGQNTKISVV